MKLKSDHFLYAAGACLGSGLALILFGAGRLLNNQPGDTMLTAGGIVLLIGLALYWLSDEVAAEEERRQDSAQSRPQCGVPAGSGARGMSAKTRRACPCANTDKPKGDEIARSHHPEE